MGELKCVCVCVKIFFVCLGEGGRVIVHREKDKEEKERLSYRR